MKRIVAVAVAAAGMMTAQQAYAVDFCVGQTKLGGGSYAANIGNGNGENGNGANTDAQKCVPSFIVDGIADVNQFNQNSNNDGHFDVTAVSGNLANGIVTASLGHNNINTVGNAIDRFLFVIPGQTGVGSGSLNSTGFQFTVSDLDFTEVSLFNGFNTYYAQITNGFASFANLNTIIPIFGNTQNILTVKYNVPGVNGVAAGAQYDGNLLFQPVPEPATWAMMLLGFGAIGFAMRRRQKQPQVRFAF